jgi:hypothetical protein
MIDAYCNLLVLLMEVYRLQNENTPDKKYASMRCIKHLMDLMFCRGFKTLDITTAMSDNMFSSNSDHLKRIKAESIRMLLMELMQTVVDDYAAAPTNPDASPCSTERVLKQLQDSVDILVYVLSGDTSVAETVSAPDEEEYRDEPSLFTLDELRDALPGYACEAHVELFSLGARKHYIWFIQKQEAIVPSSNLVHEFFAGVRHYGAALKPGLTVFLMHKTIRNVQIQLFNSARNLNIASGSDKLMTVVGHIQNSVVDYNHVAVILMPVL